MPEWLAKRAAEDKLHLKYPPAAMCVVGGDFRVHPLRSLTDEEQQREERNIAVGEESREEATTGPIIRERVIRVPIITEERQQQMYNQLVEFYEQHYPAPRWLSAPIPFFPTRRPRRPTTANNNVSVATTGNMVVSSAASSNAGDYSQAGGNLGVAGIPVVFDGCCPLSLRPLPGERPPFAFQPPPSNHNVVTGVESSNDSNQGINSLQGEGGGQEAFESKWFKRIAPRSPQEDNMGASLAKKCRTA